ncbi:hypothetical protein ACLED1_06000 [Lonsdalea quercina]
MNIQARIRRGAVAEVGMIGVTNITLWGFLDMLPGPNQGAVAMP